MCGSPSTKINPVWREQINPQNTPLESLGLLIGKNLKFEEHSKRICDRIRTIKTQVDRNFANKSEEILEKIAMELRLYSNYTLSYLLTAQPQQHTGLWSGLAMPPNLA